MKRGAKRDARRARPSSERGLAGRRRRRRQDESRAEREVTNRSGGKGSRSGRRGVKREVGAGAIEQPFAPHSSRNFVGTRAVDATNSFRGDHVLHHRGHVPLRELEASLHHPLRRIELPADDRLPERVRGDDDERGQGLGVLRGQEAGAATLPPGACRGGGRCPPRGGARGRPSRPRRLTRASSPSPQPCTRRSR